MENDCRSNYDATAAVANDSYYGCTHSVGLVALCLRKTALVVDTAAVHATLGSARGVLVIAVVVGLCVPKGGRAVSGRGAAVFVACLWAAGQRLRG